MLNEQPSRQQRQRTAEIGVCSLNEEQQFWNGKEGDGYIKRNQDLTNFQYHTDRLSITQSFFKDIPRDASILEIGCNTGNIITILRDMGFTDITGIDINAKAISIIEKKFPQYTFIHSAIEDFPPTKKYDLVYTSGVLIHIHPNNIARTINKIKTLSRKWIFGFEYYSEITMAQNYHGIQSWSGNYGDMFGRKPSRMEIHKTKDEAHCFYLFS